MLVPKTSSLRILIFLIIFPLYEEKACWLDTEIGPADEADPEITRRSYSFFVKRNLEALFSRES
jgi:hypothetical protein